MQWMLIPSQCESRDANCLLTSSCKYDWTAFFPSFNPWINSTSKQIEKPLGLCKSCNSWPARWIRYKVANWFIVFGEQLSRQWKFELYVRASVGCGGVSHWIGAGAIAESTASFVWLCVAKSCTKYDLSNAIKFNSQSSRWQKGVQSRNGFDCCSSEISARTKSQSEYICLIGFRFLW